MTGMNLDQIQASDRCRAVGAVLGRIGDKWTVLVILSLKDGPKRFSALKRGIGSISQRMLTLTLRGLERDGLVLRVVTPTNPPRVDYDLTDLGHSVKKPVEALGNWVFENLDRIEAARATFDLQVGSDLGGFD